MQLKKFNSISERIEEGKKIEWDKPIEKGDRVAVNTYMINIGKDIT